MGNPIDSIWFSSIHQIFIRTQLYWAMIDVHLAQLATNTSTIAVQHTSGFKEAQMVLNSQMEAKNLLSS
jgi:hypothetical protein